MDLSGVVILFDEMDALAQKRDSETPVDTESKFLTTYMLPKLTKLHDRGRVVFFMATNFQAHFDDAIKRAGRFDFLLCMGPPTLEAKCGAIHAFYGAGDESTPQTEHAGALIREFCERDSWLKQQLQLYAFGEFKSFITGLAEKSSIADKIAELGFDGLVNALREDSKSASMRVEDLLPILKKYKCKSWRELDGKDDFDIESLRKKKMDIQKAAIKYVLDRKQSRRQCARLKGED
jgi:hypothetical protein